MPMKRKRLGDDWGDHAPLDLASTNLGKKISVVRATTLPTGFTTLQQPRQAKKT